VSFLDERFKRNKARYVGQTALATLMIIAVLLVLDAISNAAIIAAFGASFFIAFTVPHRKAADARHLIGSYLVGAAVGTACYWLSEIPLVSKIIILPQDVYTVFGAAAVGLTMLAMVVFQAEHPPAASVALGLVLEWRPKTVLVVLVGIVALYLVKRTLRRSLIDLL